MITCPKCQQQLIDGAKFCEHCGTSMIQQVQPVHNAANYVKQNMQHNVNKLVQLKKKGLNIPHLILIALSLFMVITLLMPFISATGYRLEVIKDDPDEIVSEELDMTAEDLKNVSIFEYAHITSELDGDSEEGTIYKALIAILVIFMVLALLFAVVKKPVGTIIFNILSTAVFSFHGFMFIESGVVTDGGWTFGAGFFIYYVVALLAFASAIVLMIRNLKEKKAKKKLMMNYR